MKGAEGSAGSRIESALRFNQRHEKWGKSRAERLAKSRGDRQPSRVVDDQRQSTPILGAHVFSSTREAHMRVRSIHWPRAAGRREGQRAFAVERGQTPTNGRTRRAEPRPRGASLGVVVGRQAGEERQSPPAPDLEWTSAVSPLLPSTRLLNPPPATDHLRLLAFPNTPPIIAPDAVIGLAVMHGAGGTPVPHSHTDAESAEHARQRCTVPRNPSINRSRPWYVATWALTNPDEASLHTWMRTLLLSITQPRTLILGVYPAVLSRSDHLSCLVTMDRFLSMSLLQAHRQTVSGLSQRRRETTKLGRSVFNPPGDKPPDKQPDPAPWSYQLGGYAL